MKLITLFEHVRITVFGSPMNPSRVDDYVFAYVQPPLDFADTHEVARIFTARPQQSYANAVGQFRLFARRNNIHGKAMPTNQYFIDNNGIPLKQTILDTN